MRTGAYRLLVLGCALSWFMVGLHAPILHHIAEHAAKPSWSLLAAMAFLVVLAVAALARLLTVSLRSTEAQR